MIHTGLMDKHYAKVKQSLSSLRSGVQIKASGPFSIHTNATNIYASLLFFIALFIYFECAV